MNEVDVVRKRPDYLFLFLALGLIAFGVLMIYSSTSVMAEYNTGSSLSVVTRQTMWIGLGIAGMIFTYTRNEEKMRKFTGWLFLGCMVSLFLVLFVGKTVNGAKSWFGIGPFGGQPTEFAKLGLIMYLSLLLSKKGDKMKDFKKGLMPAMVLSGIVLLLVFRQPDLGGCMVIAAIACVVMFVGGAHLKHVLVGLGIASVVLTLAALIFFMKSGPSATDNGDVAMKDQNYKASRITCFLDPLSDPLKGCYQTLQSLFALSHGGIAGTGIGKSVEKIGYLPESHNDFIVAIIGEEFGFVGMVIFLLAYIGLILRGIVISMKSTSTFLGVAGVGIMSMFGIQAIINIGGVTNSMPMTGITLPLISAGGSSLIVSMMGIGIVLSISRGHLGTVKQKKQKDNKKSNESKDKHMRIPFGR